MNTPNKLAYTPQDEISLIDLWLMLMRHKILIFTVIVGCLLLALAYVSITQTQYRYSTTIEIGTVSERTMKGEQGELIDDPETLLAKIEEGYIPKVLKEHAKNSPNGKTHSITARVPKRSSLVILEAKASEQDGNVIKQLENQIIELVKADHARISEVRKSDINTAVANEERTLASQEDAKKLAQSRLAYNKVLITLLKDQINSGRKQMADIIANRKRARNKVGNEARAMTLMMIDNEIQQNRQRVAEIEERIAVKIPAENDKLHNEVADILRQQEKARAKIEQLRVELRNIKETRAIIPPTRSLAPAGPRKSLTITLGGFLGIFLGVFAAFLSEMLKKVRQQLAISNSSH